MSDFYANLHLQEGDTVSGSHSDVNGRACLVFAQGGISTLVLWLGREDDIAIRNIDKLLELLAEERERCLARITADEPAHDKPFHLGYQPGCPACEAKRKATKPNEVVAL